MQPSIPWSNSVSLFVIEMMAMIHSLKCTVPFSFAVHCSHLLSLIAIRCHSVTHFHSLYHLSLVVRLVSFYKGSQNCWTQETLISLHFVLLFSEAATSGVLLKQVFLVISQNLHLRPATLIKRGSDTGVSCDFAIFLRTLFTEHLWTSASMFNLIIRHQQNRFKMLNVHYQSK